MSQNKDILEKLIKPLKLEIRLKGMNTSVFGGFDKYAIKWSNHLQVEDNDEELKELAYDIKNIFLDYNDVAIHKRISKLKKALSLINNYKNKEMNIDLPLNKSRSKDKLKEEGESRKKSDQKSEELLEFWHDTLRYIKGVGKRWANKLKSLGIKEVKDLFYYLPRDYNDWSNCYNIHQLQDGMEVTVRGRVVKINELKPRRGLKIIKIGISDGSGVLYGTWFNQAYIKSNFKRGEDYLFSGEVKYKYGEYTINNPHYEKLEIEDNIHTARIVPLYSIKRGISQKHLRRVIKNCLDKYSSQFFEFLPQFIMKKYDFLEFKEAIKAIHFPDSKEELKEARRRLAYEELFVLQLSLALRRSGIQVNHFGIKHKADNEFVEGYLNRLPFQLTGAQNRVWQEIRDDMESAIQMNRLIQGDVGAGKTVIATLALLKTIQSGLQGALMAPTEILAEQHYIGIKDELEDFGFEVGLLVGSLTAKEKEDILVKIRTGEIDIVIGTHALIQDDIQFAKLGLAIIDEQHRFGVKQRTSLQEKGDNPDILVMTATPIPRTLALTVYGDLDISVIDELPPGRKPIITEWRTKEAREEIYYFVDEEIEKGRQVYVVCPLVEESEKIDIESATRMAEYLSEVFGSRSIGLLHGQLKSDAKEEMMRQFKDGELDILVSTTVIEVGVDVPNASIMIIEDAQRFGLAQLHQLRGRVGRGEYQSYCVLIAHPSTEQGRERMRIMASSNDGFVIAEEDLHLRGPGEFFGTRQHGMPDLKVADILRDQKLLEAAREDAFKLVKEDPNLEKNKILKKVLIEYFDYDFELGNSN